MVVIGIDPWPYGISWGPRNLLGAVELRFFRDFWDWISWGFTGLWWESGWWFGTCFMTFHILGIVTPTDFHIFQRGGSTTNQGMLNYSFTVTILLSSWVTISSNGIFESWLTIIITLFFRGVGIPPTSNGIPIKVISIAPPKWDRFSGIWRDIPVSIIVSSNTNFPIISLWGRHHFYLQVWFQL